MFLVVNKCTSFLLNSVYLELFSWKNLFLFSGKNGVNIRAFRSCMKKTRHLTRFVEFGMRQNLVIVTRLLEKS